MNNNVIKIKLSKILIVLLIPIIIIGIAIALFFLNKAHSSIKNNIIKVRYAYDYTVPTADILNNSYNNENYIDILTIYIKDDNYIKLNQMLDNVSFEKVDFSIYDYTNLEIGVGGKYEVTLPNGSILLLDNDSQWAYYSNNKDSYIIEINMEFVNEIDRIVQEEINNQS